MQGYRPDSDMRLTEMYNGKRQIHNLTFSRLFSCYHSCIHIHLFESVRQVEAALAAQDSSTNKGNAIPATDATTLCQPRRESRLVQPVPTTFQYIDPSRPPSTQRILFIPRSGQGS